MKKRKSGFTIVELLIVIVVIAILATISVVAYGGVRQRAQVTAIVSDLKAAEKAFTAYKIASGTNNWWLDSDTSLTGGDPKISSILNNNAEFRNFLQKPPSADGLRADTGQAWTYDNDGDTYNGCGSSPNGVNIAIDQVRDHDFALAVDRAIDDGNLSCGKLRMWWNMLLYNLAPS